MEIGLHITEIEEVFDITAQGCYLDVSQNGRSMQDVPKEPYIGYTLLSYDIVCMNIHCSGDL